MLCEKCKDKVDPKNGTIFIRGMCKKCDRKLTAYLIERLKTGNKKAKNARI